MVEIAGTRCKAALGVITLPYSDTYFLTAYPRECTETFQAAHVAGFEFFGGVPIRTSYDNTTIAVSKVLGRDRILPRAFLAPNHSKLDTRATIRFPLPDFIRAGIHER